MPGAALRCVVRGKKIGEGKDFPRNRLTAGEIFDLIKPFPPSEGGAADGLNREVPRAMNGGTPVFFEIYFVRLSGISFNYLKYAQWTRDGQGRVH